jgi:hypothetical protein
MKGLQDEPEGRFGIVELAQDEACGRQVDARPGDLGERLAAGGQGRQVAQCALCCFLRLPTLTEVEPCRRRAGLGASAAEREFAADLLAKRVPVLADSSQRPRSNAVDAISTVACPAIT